MLNIGKIYKRLISSVPRGALDQKTYVILKDFGKYFDKFPNKDVIEMPSFLPRFKQWHKELNDESYLVYAKILRNVQKDVEEETKAAILGDMAELSLGTKLANLAEQYNAGELEYPLGDLVSQELDKYKKNRGATGFSWENTPIDELLQEDANDEGVKWRLQVLSVKCPLSFSLSKPNSALIVSDISTVTISRHWVTLL